MKNTSPDIKSFRRNFSLSQEFYESKDEKEQAMNIIKAIEKLEEEKKEIQERQNVCWKGKNVCSMQPIKILL